MFYTSHFAGDGKGNALYALKPGILTDNNKGRNKNTIIKAGQELCILHAYSLIATQVTCMHCVLLATWKLFIKGPLLDWVCGVRDA